MLALEIEYLTGTAVASSSPDETQFDWPPQPDRVFSALVASWGARGCRANERVALEWLERQNAPRIIATDAQARTVAKVFVPPNDFKTSTNGRFDVLPARRKKQERYFPTGRPHDNTLKLVWPVDTEREIQGALDAVARDTAYVGQSSSLTRCRFVEGEFDLATSRAPLRSVYEGRLAELERLFHAGRRPGPGEVVVISPCTVEENRPQGVFSDKWIVLANAGGNAPDLRAAPLVAKKIRDALMGAYQRAIGHPPEWLSGHESDGSPSASPHLAVVPMADVGWAHSGGRLLGFAVVPPRVVSPEALFEAIATLMETRGDERNIELHYGASAPCYLVPSEFSERKASLRPGRWTKAARLWATATPIVLDRYPKKSDPNERMRETGALIEAACQNIGLPRPAYVRVDSNSAVPGAPSACVHRDAPQWQRWQVPRSLQGRHLVHAIFGFDDPVQGPVLLGAGRYVGLGLCKPIEDAEQ